MPTIEEQIDFIRAEYDASMELSTMEENSYHYLKDAAMYSAIMESLKMLQSNDLVLQQTCSNCGASFITANKNKAFCSTKCRVSYFRKQNMLKEFTTKVGSILHEKETDPKFVIGVLIVPDGDCPFKVEYKGNVYEGKSTREILTKLRKIQ